VERTDDHGPGMKPLERWLIRWSSWATGLTGLVYLWMKYSLEPSEPFAAFNHPLQPWVLKAHILVAPIAVFAIGMIAVSHAWRHWASRAVAGRRSGVLLGLATAPMILTGYLVQAIVHRTWLTVTAWTHIVVGFLFLAGLMTHLIVYRGGKGRGRRQQPS
jgi:hypothetical protein